MVKTMYSQKKGMDIYKIIICLESLNILLLFIIYILMMKVCSNNKLDGFGSVYIYVAYVV